MSLVATGTALAETEALATELQSALRLQGARLAGKAARHGVKAIFKGMKRAAPRYGKAFRASMRVDRARKRARRSHRGEQGAGALSKRSCQFYRNATFEERTLQTILLGDGIPAGFEEGERHSDRIWVSGVNVRFTMLNNTTGYPINLRMCLVNASSPDFGNGQQMFKDIVNSTTSGVDYTAVNTLNPRDAIITPLNQSNYGVLMDKVYTIGSKQNAPQGCQKYANFWVPINQYFHYGDNILPNLRLHWFYTSPDAGISGAADIDLQTHLFYRNKN